MCKPTTRLNCTLLFPKKEKKKKTFILIQKHTRSKKPKNKNKDFNDIHMMNKLYANSQIIFRRVETYVKLIKLPIGVRVPNKGIPNDQS